MASSSRERLEALRASHEGRIGALMADLDSDETLPVEPTELARAERTRAARAFGFMLPTFRTSVRMRFSGTGVEKHDLSGLTAGAVISRFTSAVEAAGKHLALGPGKAAMFLSPNVAPGSTILELFGPEVEAPAAETLDTEIDDTPLDSALSYVFEVLDSISDDDLEPSAAEPVDGDLGAQLFHLSEALLQGEVDLDLRWRRPRGSSRAVGLSRGRARLLQAILDVESREVTPREGFGELSSVSTTGVIGFVPDGKVRPIPIASDVDPGVLRDLWARRVEVRWTETVVRHPQRKDRQTTHTLTAIAAAPEIEAADADEVETQAAADAVQTQAAAQIEAADGDEVQTQDENGEEEAQGAARIAAARDVLRTMSDAERSQLPRTGRPRAIEAGPANRGERRDEGGGQAPTGVVPEPPPPLPSGDNPDEFE